MGMGKDRIAHNYKPHRLYDAHGRLNFNPRGAEGTRLSVAQGGWISWGKDGVAGPFEPGCLVKTCWVSSVG